MSYILKNLNKSFKNKKILNDFTIQIPESGVICIIGNSGCGKTTLMNIMAGIESVDSGNINDINDIKKSYVFQEDLFIPWLSVGDNISLMSKFCKSDIEFLLKSFNLYNVYDKKPSELSGGMKQRVNIVRALCVDFEMIFMDEPFKGIDKNNKDLAIDIIKKYIKDKLCIMVTHEISEALSIADKIYFVEGPPLKILKVKTLESRNSKL